MTKGVSVIALVAALGCNAPFSVAQTPQKLSLQEAEAIALKNHPLVEASRLSALAARQVVTEAKSAYYPFAYSSLTGAAAESGSRIAAGVLNNPIIYNRYANGVTVSQLLTDFGRTPNLVASSSLHAQAQDENAQATREDVLLQVDRLLLRGAPR
jgi:outer membrane protein